MLFLGGGKVLRDFSDKPYSPPDRNTEYRHQKREASKTENHHSEKKKNRFEEFHVRCVLRELVKSLQGISLCVLYQGARRRVGTRTVRLGFSWLCF